MSTAVEGYTFPLNVPRQGGVLIGLQAIQHRQETWLCAWNARFVYLFTLSSADFNVAQNIASKLIQVIKLPNIRDVVLSSNGKYLICLGLDTEGLLHLVYSTSGRPSKETAPLLHNILSMCLAKEEKLCILQRVGKDLTLQLCSLHAEGLKTFSSTIIVTESYEQEALALCHIKCLTCATLSDDLRHQLCSTPESNQCGIVWVTQHRGNVLRVSYDQTGFSSKPEQVLEAAVSHEVRDGRRTLFIDNDSMIILSPGKFNSSERKLLCQTSASSFLTASMDQHTWCHRLVGSKIVETRLRFRGIVAACAVKPGVVIATTRHHLTYCIDLSRLNAVDSCLSEDDPEQAFETIKHLTSEITRVNEALKQEDTLLTQLSFMKQASLLKDQFSLIVHVYEIPHLQYKLDIKIENQSPINIPADIWSLQANLIGRTVNLVETHMLSKNFNSSDIVRLVIESRLEKTEFPLSLECKIVSNFPSEKRGSWCVLSIGKLNLDATYFMTPTSSLSHVQEYSPESDCPPCEMYSYHLTMHTEENLNEIAKVFTKSCASKAWAIRNNKCLAFKVMDARVEFQIRDGKTMILCTDLLILQQVQEFVRKNLRQTQESSATVHVESLIPIKIENIKLAIDFAKAQHGRVEEKEVSSLHQILRETVTAQLPPPI
ncbi:hypothetical protein B566_EDAN004338 [Ephemera danica]|nr:hypothetical protein B566_EDAN004338 [Ephemera danica]